MATTVFLIQVKPCIVAHLLANNTSYLLGPKPAIHNIENINILPIYDKLHSPIAWDKNKFCCINNFTKKIVYGPSCFIQIDVHNGIIHLKRWRLKELGHDANEFNLLGSSPWKCYLSHIECKNTAQYNTVYEQCIKCDCWNYPKQKPKYITNWIQSIGHCNINQQQNNILTTFRSSDNNTNFYTFLLKSLQTSFVKSISMVCNSEFNYLKKSCPDHHIIYTDTRLEIFLANDSTDSFVSGQYYNDQIINTEEDNIKHSKKISDNTYSFLFVVFNKEQPSKGSRFIVLPTPRFIAFSNILLGYGGNGAVFLGFDRSKSVFVAMKRQKSSQLKKEAMILQTAKCRNAVELLAYIPSYESLYTVNQDLLHNYNCSNIQSYDYRYVNGIPIVYPYRDNLDDWIVLEFLRGGTLRQAIKALYANGIPIEATRILFYELIQTLNHLHMVGVVHRDLKCANVMLLESPFSLMCTNDKKYNKNNLFEDVKINENRKNSISRLIDFGNSNLINSKLCRNVNGESSMLFGNLTTCFATAPEIILTVKGQIDGYDDRCDIWSAGTMLFEMITGRRLFEIEKLEQLESSLKYWSVGCLDSEPKLQETSSALRLLKGLLNKDPDARLSLKQILHHPFFASFQNPPQINTFFDLQGQLDSKQPSLNELYQNRNRMTTTSTTASSSFIPRFKSSFNIDSKQQRINYDRNCQINPYFCCNNKFLSSYNCAISSIEKARCTNTNVFTSTTDYLNNCSNRFAKQNYGIHKNHCCCNVKNSQCQNSETDIIAKYSIENYSSNEYWLPPFVNISFNLNSSCNCFNCKDRFGRMGTLPTLRRYCKYNSVTDSSLIE